MKTRLATVLLTLVLGAMAFNAPAQDSTESDGSKDTAEVIVDLKGGDRIRGRLVGESDKMIVVVSPILGTVSLPRDQVEKITVVNAEKEGEDAEKTKAAKDKADKEAAEAAEEATKPKSPWSGSVLLGLTYSDASKVTLNLNLGGSLKKETDLETFLLTGKYFFARDSKAVTSNDVIIVGDQTWYLSKGSRWSIFAQATYQWDQFHNWEHRVSPYAGIGYELIKEEDLKVGARFGGGGTWQYAGKKGFTPQFFFELMADWEIDELQSLIGSVKFAPAMRNFSHYLLTTSFNYKLKLGSDTPLSFNFSVLDIYDSNPGHGSTANDLKVILSLGYDF